MFFSVHVSIGKYLLMFINWYFYFNELSVCHWFAVFSNKACCISNNSNNSDIVSAMPRNYLASEYGKINIFVNNSTLFFLPPRSLSWFLMQLFMVFLSLALLFGINIFFRLPHVFFFQRSQSLLNTNIYLLLQMSVWIHCLAKW